ncbi:LacI family DNA-binding transcriptional regulator [Microbacterium sp. KNMS]
MATKRTRRHPVRQTTISDIAELAGVSKATVSRVMNGVPTVAEDIAERVRAAIDELGYTPSQTARSLSLGVSRTIGVLVPDLSNPMFHQVLHGVHRAAAADGYRVLVADTLEDEAGEAASAIDIRNRTDAVVLIAPRMTRPELLDLLPRVQPVAVVNRTTGRNAAVAQVDYATGIQTLAQHLVDLGHERIAFLSGPEASRSNHERLRGLIAFREAHPDIEIRELACGSGFEDGYRAWDDVRGSGATAVLAFNDIVALGLLGRLDEEGVRVPDDLSVTGFDDIPFSRYSAPPLTTMTVDLPGVGAAVWRELHDEIGGGLRRDPVVFTPALTVRASTGPRP